MVFWYSNGVSSAFWSHLFLVCHPSSGRKGQRPSLSLPSSFLCCPHSAGIGWKGGPRLQEFCRYAEAEVSWGMRRACSRISEHPLFETCLGTFENVWNADQSYGYQVIHDPGGEEGCQGKGAGCSVHWYFLKNLFECGLGCLSDTASWIWESCCRRNVPFYQIHILILSWRKASTAHIWVAHGRAERDREDPKPDSKSL